MKLMQPRSLSTKSAIGHRQISRIRHRNHPGILILAATVIIGFSGCDTREPAIEIDKPEPSITPQLFFMDLVPATGLGLYLTPTNTKTEMSGGIFRWDGKTAEILTQDLIFPHNIEPFEDGYIFTDPELEVIRVVDRSGEASHAFSEMVWLDGGRDSLLDTNWVLPLQTTEAEAFLDPDILGHPVVLICRARTVGDETWMWWSICTIEDGVLRSLWEMKSPGRKAHTGLLHDGVFYGASSGSETLVVKGADLDFELPVGNIRYMEVFNGELWMAGDGFVGVLDNLPPAADAEPRIFVQGIGRAQAVHVSDERVFVTANGWLLVFDRNGRRIESVGTTPPESGDSWIHDRLRALGYLE